MLNSSFLKIVSRDAEISTGGPLAILDRDGVINRDREGHVKSWGEFEFLPGALEALAELKKAGVCVALASNQSGVARGLFTVEELVAIHGGMTKRILAAGGEVNAAYYCIHGPDAGCSCRKPNPGMLKAALSDFGAAPWASFMVGDAARDMDAGKSAGLTTILVLTGHAAHYSAKRLAELSPDFVAGDLLRAAEIVSGLAGRQESPRAGGPK